MRKVIGMVVLSTALAFTTIMALGLGANAASDEAWCCAVSACACECGGDKAACSCDAGCQCSNCGSGCCAR